MALTFLSFNFEFEFDNYSSILVLTILFLIMAYQRYLAKSKKRCRETWLNKCPSNKAIRFFVNFNLCCQLEWVAPLTCPREERKLSFTPVRGCILPNLANIPNMHLWVRLSNSNSSLYPSHKKKMVSPPILFMFSA